MEKETEKLADSAYSTVLHKILAHELVGAAVIHERNLAESMGISRTPMREALGRLEGEGLLVRLTQRLLAVRVITLEDYLHSLDIRALIEPQAAALAVRHVTPSDIAVMEAGLADIERVAEPVADMHWRFDDLLHETIAARSGNPFFLKVILEMRRYTKIFERQTVPMRFKPGTDDHAAIIKALAAAAPEKARQAMGNHLKKVRKRILEGF